MVSDCQLGEPGRAFPRFSTASVRGAIVAAGLSLGLAALGGCGQGDLCETSYVDICVPNPNHVATANPRPVFAPASTAVAPPGGGVAPMGGVAPAAGSVPRGAVPIGDPSTFADVDDKQCRSYGLTFGTHDYADCRIRLSAQHRGLDPNAGTTQPR